MTGTRSPSGDIPKERERLREGERGFEEGETERGGGEKRGREETEREMERDGKGREGREEEEEV